MAFDWFASLIIGKERKTEARDSAAPAAQKLQDMIAMVKDPNALFSVSKTLEVLSELKTELSPSQKQSQPGADLLYLQGHILALYEDWCEAMVYWNDLKQHPYGGDKLGEYEKAQVNWAATMCDYDNDIWDKALDGLNQRIVEENGRGKSGILELWPLHIMRGRCLLGLRRFAEVETLMQSCFNEALSKGEELYDEDAERITEPLRIIAEARRMQGDILGALKARARELDYYEVTESDAYGYDLLYAIKEAVKYQQWDMAHYFFDRASKYTEALENDFTKKKMIDKLEPWRLKRTGWPKAKSAMPA